MTGIKNPGYIKAREYVYDFDVSGGTFGTAINLDELPGQTKMPIGSIILDVVAKVVTAPTSLGSATCEWGNEDDPNGYSNTAIPVATLIDNYVASFGSIAAPLGWDDDNDHPIRYPVTTADQGEFKFTINIADLITGKIIFTVLYLEPSAA